MNYKVYLLLFILLLSAKVFAQEKKLTIQISKNDPPNFVVKFNRVPILNEGTLTTESSKWTINVTYLGAKNYDVVLKNNEGDGDSLLIEDFAKTYEVENDKVKDTEFLISKSFDVILVEGGVSKAMAHTIDYSKSKKTSVADPGGDKSLYAPGSAIYDANYLKTGSDPNTKLSILAYYGNCAAQSDSIIKAYEGNKFLTAADIRRLLATPGSQSKVGTLLKGAVSSIGGLDVTNLADGLAKFLVKRTKEELNIAFFQDFRDFLQREEFKDLQTVFPETYRTFNIIGEEIYNFDRYLQTMRESFRSDLSNLTTNLKTIVDNHPLFFEKYPELRGTFLSGLYIAESIRDKVHPGDILAGYPTGCDRCLDDLGVPVKGSIQILRLFSETLRNPSGIESEYWASGQYLKQSFKDTQITTYYFGLTRQLALTRYDKIPLSATSTLVGVLDSIGVETQVAYQNYLLRFIQKSDKLTKMIKEYSKPANDSLALEQYYNYFKASVDLLEYSAEAGALPKMPAKFSKLKELSKDYFDIANTTSDLVLDINRKNYSSAVRNAVHIYEVIKVRRSKIYTEQLKTEIAALDKEINGLNKEVATLKADNPQERDRINEKETGLSHKVSRSAQMKSEQDMEDVSQSVMDKLFKYGTFMATLLTAETSDEVEEVIESFALPTGSARIKRETAFNVALNAYLGAYGGWEQIRGLETEKNGTYGLTAPIGVSISRGHSILFFINTGNVGWSTSLFISVIDLGAIASFRFTSETVPTDTSATTVYEIPDIQFEDIFSPGAFISFGIPKSPLSINLGAQVGPNLRKVSVSSVDNTVVNDYADRMYWRFSISFVVDIPILNFYSRSREK